MAVKPRVCFVCDKAQLGREYLPIHNAMERRFDFVRHFVDDVWPDRISQIPDYSSYDAIIWFVKYRHLILRPPFDWDDYKGMRLMHDQDAYQNFSAMAGTRFLDTWPEVYRRHGFHVLACTGMATRDNLKAGGVNAVWVPKAYEPQRFRDLRSPRAGICYFGEPYAARKAMLRRTYAAGIRVERFKCSYFELNNYLNRYALCLICNFSGRDERWWEVLADRLHLPRTPTRWGQAPEAMLKNFEVAGAGCVPVCDEIPELAYLGFRDGVTMISYRDFDELVDKIRHYRDRPDEVAAIGKRAAALCAQWHSWDQRAEMFAAILEGRRPDPDVDPAWAKVGDTVSA